MTKYNIPKPKEPVWERIIKWVKEFDEIDLFFSCFIIGIIIAGIATLMEFIINT